MADVKSELLLQQEYLNHPNQAILQELNSLGVSVGILDANFAGLRNL